MRICWFYVTLKIGLSSIERIYLIYGILENAKTWLYGNKTDDVKQWFGLKQTQSLLYFLLSRDENLSNID